MNEEIFDNAREVIARARHHRPQCCIGPTGPTGPTGPAGGPTGATGLLEQLGLLD